MITTIDMGKIGPQDCEVTGKIDGGMVEDMRVHWSGVDITDLLAADTIQDIAQQMIEAEIERIAGRQYENEIQNWDEGA